MNLSDSCLFEIYEKVQNMADFPSAQKLVLDHLSKQKQSTDIRQMRVEVQYEIHDLRKLIFWMYNKMQAYTGLKTIQTKH